MKIRWEWIGLAVCAGLLPTLAPAGIESAPVAYLPGIQTAWEQRAADMGIEVVFTDDERNCGGAITGWGYGGGCFDPATPDRIYVGTWLSASALETVALHELAHAWGYSQGTGSSECGADTLAYLWGAPGPFFYCDPRAG